MTGDFAPYEPASWQVDGLLVASPPRQERDLRTVTKRACPWVSVLVFSAASATTATTTVRPAAASAACTVLRIEPDESRHSGAQHYSDHVLPDHWTRMRAFIDTMSTVAENDEIDPEPLI